MATSNILASAATSVSYNMLLQLAFRLVTFILNAFMLRFISKDMLGVVNVRLTLLYSTVLFVAREAFRRACLSKATNRNWPQVINLLWCIVPIGCVSAGVFGGVWGYVLEPPHPDSVPHYHIGVACFALSTVVELLAEPLYVVGQVLLMVRLKVLIEGTSLALRCVLTVVLTLLLPHWGLLVFCIAQITFTAVYTVLYYTYFTYLVFGGRVKKDDNFPFQTVRDFFPKWTSTQPLFSWETVTLTWSLFKQSFLKQILTEGERYVMTVFDVLNFGDQGVYDIINNLGSLAARFFFLPIEDGGYLFFSHTLNRGIAAKDQPKDSIEFAAKVLQCLLKGVSVIGLVILVFGYPYSHLLLDLYGGKILSSGSGPSLLRWYCVYVLLLAVNGVTECFVFAAMSQQEVNRYNHKMLLISVVFLSSSLYLTRLLGSVGFILANCVNMSARVTHSIIYIKRYFKDSTCRPLTGIIPSYSVLAAYLVVWVITTMSESVFCCAQGALYRLLHVCVGAVCLATLGAVVYGAEHQLVQFVTEQYRKSRTQKSDTDKHS